MLKFVQTALVKLKMSKQSCSNCSGDKLLGETFESECPTNHKITSNLRRSSHPGDLSHIPSFLSCGHHKFNVIYVIIRSDRESDKITV